MVDTVRTLSALQTLLADNTDGDIGAQDIRDFLVSVFPYWHLGGDSGYYWSGSDLSSFTTQTVSGTATWTEGVGQVSVKVNNQTANDAAVVLIAESFSTGDEWVVPILGVFGMDMTTQTGTGCQAGLVFTDGTAAGSNAVAAHVQVPIAATDGTFATHFTALSSLAPIGVGRHGTLTAMSNAPWVSDATTIWRSQIVFAKLRYSASNTFQVEFSPDGLSWSAFGEADISKTMTPTHVGLYSSFPAAFDGICTFGPLVKVA